MAKNCVGHCLPCRLNREHGCNYKGHYGYDRTKPEPAEWPFEMLAKIRREEEGKPPLAPKQVEPLIHRLPFVNGMLTVTEFDDGSPRVPATMLTYWTGSSWKVCLHDREKGRSVWSEGPTIHGALENIEKDNAEGKTVWKSSFKRSQ